MSAQGIVRRRTEPERGGGSGRAVGGCTVRRETLEDPPLAQRLALIGTAVQLHEVARARVHREFRLGREVAVVPLDQLVHLREAPAACGLEPEPPELLPVGSGLGELAPRVAELPLVLLGAVFDRAQ